MAWLFEGAPPIAICVVFCLFAMAAAWIKAMLAFELVFTVLLFPVKRPMPFDEFEPAPEALGPAEG